MDTDYTKFVKRCHECQIHGNLNHLSPSELYSMTSPWPFSIWGIDIIGKISPMASNGHRFIIVAIDYFTKWVEAESYKVVGAKQINKFVRNNLICRFGVPHEIVSDNGTQFKGDFLKLIAKFKNKHRKSSPYRPQTNGAVEAAKKNVKTILRKMVETYKDWPKKLPYAL
ncbi:uncharacterized protein LOC131174636 [Hevea brasiliensis]|uniref:uncharacterized protein LOC131174636 n=1 Tax=Hevea brasiliensis TaxID=3981 RepID=UPI0025DA4164|nr:uncharacterized protein LOC131174636 [Hevea brasiliensis]